MLAGLVNGGKGRAQSEAARIAAINLLLDRGYGRATQPIDATTRRADADLRNLTDGELLEIIGGNKKAIDAADYAPKGAPSIPPSSSKH